MAYELKEGDWVIVTESKDKWRHSAPTGPVEILRIDAFLDSIIVIETKPGITRNTYGYEKNRCVKVNYPLTELEKAIYNIE